MKRRTVTIAELAEILGIGWRTVYDHIVGDEIVFEDVTFSLIRLGARVVVPTKEVEDLLGESLEVSA